MNTKPLDLKIKNILNELYSESLGPFNVTWDDLTLYTPYWSPNKIACERHIPFNCFYLDKVSQDSIVNKHISRIRVSKWDHPSDEILCNFKNYRTYQLSLKDHGAISPNTAYKRINKYKNDHNITPAGDNIYYIKYFINNFAPTYNAPTVFLYRELFDKISSAGDNIPDIVSKYVYPFDIRAQHAVVDMRILHGLKYNMEHDIKTNYDYNTQSTYTVAP